MNETILVINAGSSSIKFAVWPIAEPAGSAMLNGEVSRVGQDPHFRASNGAGEILADSAWEQSGSEQDALFRELTEWIIDHTAGAPIAAAGHRVVHGGTKFAAPVLIDEAVIRDLQGLIPLAPLHQPYNLAAIQSLAATHPGLPQVACFDTAFHMGRADMATRFALPRQLHDAGVRRYGFHGLSYDFIARALARKAPDLAGGRIVIAHLGNGSSLCAVRDGMSIDTTMSFTALDGLPMGTRTGSIDAGVLLFLMAQGMGSEAIQHMLYNQSGLLGVSGGISSDMRDLLASDQPEAAQAIDLFVYRVAREVAAMAACMGGIDGLVFTGGVGEHASGIRQRICDGCAWLGLELDPAANVRGMDRISAPSSRLDTWVIPTNEAQMIAIHTVDALRLAASGTASAAEEFLDA